MSDRAKTLINRCSQATRGPHAANRRHKAYYSPLPPSCHPSEHWQDGYCVCIAAFFFVWDKAAPIRFKRRGTGTVWATFQMSQERVDAIRAETDLHGRSEPQFQALVRDAANNVIAEVDRVPVVKKKERTLKPAGSTVANAEINVT